MINARDARIKTANNAIYKIFINRVDTHIESAIRLGRYDVDIASRVLGENDDLLKVPREVMELALKELEKLGYKARITNDNEILQISWED